MTGCRFKYVAKEAELAGSAAEPPFYRESCFIRGKGDKSPLSFTFNIFRLSFAKCVEIRIQRMFKLK